MSRLAVHRRDAGETDLPGRVAHLAGDLDVLENGRGHRADAVGEVGGDIHSQAAVDGQVVHGGGLLLGLLTLRIAIGFGGLFVREERHVVDLDLIAILHIAAASYPHGIKAQPARCSRPCALSKLGALIGVGSADILLGNVDQVSVPLRILCKINMNAGIPLSRISAPGRIQFNGFRSAEVFRANLKP